MLIWSGILCLRYRCDSNKFVPSRFACVPLTSPLNLFVYQKVHIHTYIHTYVVGQQPNSILGRLILEISRSRNETHTQLDIHNRWLLWTSDQHDTWDEHPCFQRDLNTRFQQSSGRRPHGHRDWQTVCSLFKCWLTPRSRNRPLNPEISGHSW